MPDVNCRIISKIKLQLQFAAQFLFVLVYLVARAKTATNQNKTEMAANEAMNN